jgi:hypothetical protein
MPRLQWPLVGGRPVVQVGLTVALTTRQLSRTLLADTGAGVAGAGIDLILRETDCQRCGGVDAGLVRLGRAYAGLFPAFTIRVRLPSLGFDKYLHAVGVPSGPRGLDGVACFPFLSRFTYGNSGDPGTFGLEA